MQKTDNSRLFEKMVSARFVRNNALNFATVSTQTLIIHKSGQCLVTEHQYRHSEQYWRRLLQPVACCKINPAKYNISNHVSLFFEVEMPSNVYVKKGSQAVESVSSAAQSSTQTTVSLQDEQSELLG